MGNLNNKRLEKKLDQCLSDLKTTKKLFSSLYKIGIMETQSNSIDKILNAIMQETQRTFDFTRLAIILLDKDKRTLECKYWIGFSPEQEKRARSRPLELDHHVCRETVVAKTGKTIIIKDVHDPRNTEFDLKMDKLYQRKSTITAPLKIKEEVIGVLAADRTNRRLDLSQNEIKLFTTFANQASIIIENARLQEQNKRKIEQLMVIQELSKKMTATLNLKNLVALIIRSALKITKGNVSALLLREDDGRYMKIVAHRGYGAINTKSFSLEMGQGIAGYVAKTGMPLMINDVQQEPRYVEVLDGLRSELAVPLITKNKTAGVLTIGSYETNVFTQEDMELLMIFAGRTATLVENARLYEEIIAGRNFAENILESSPNGIVAVDYNRRICSINRETERIFGIKRQAVIGRDMREIFSEDIARIAEMGLRSCKVVEDWEIEFTGGSRRSVILGVTSSLLKNQREVVTDVIINVRDLTEVKKTEETIKRMDRLSSLGQLSAGLAHEIRNPLASINFNVQMLSKKLGGDEVVKGIMDDTLQGISRINRLVKGIHDFAKPGIPLFKRGRLDEIIVESVGLLDAQMKKRKISVEVDIDEDMPSIAFDPLKIQQVFINLLINAMDAMLAGGTINIRNVVEYNRKGGMDYLSVYIADTGVGISSRNLSKIFDPFFTTKPEGTGLGLSIVYKILEQHNAIIETESNKGEGTTFIIKFPVNLDEATHVSIQNTNR